MGSKRKNLLFGAFTLAETLITLAIIGIVAAITVPVLMKSYQDEVYKTAYKKAYSDMNQAFAQAIQQQSLVPRDGSNDSEATKSEWSVMKNAFKTLKICESVNLFECWVDAERVCTGSCGGNEPNAAQKGFVDASGRNWATYSGDTNIYLVDTNGFKGPNQFGKDRWVLTLWNTNNTRTIAGLPTKVGVHNSSDVTSSSTEGELNWCNHPPCYYRSWLFGQN